MVATCGDIVTGALRLSRVISGNKDPKAAESERGMECLQSLYDQWVAGGMFGELDDIYLTASDTAKEGKRYLLAASVVLTEPATIEPEDNCDGVTRQPRDLAIYEKLDSSGVRSVRIYDRTAWVDLLNLELTDIAPLSSRGAMGLSGALASSGAFTAMFGASASPDVRLLARQFISGISYKIGTTRDRSRAEYF